MNNKGGEFQSVPLATPTATGGKNYNSLGKTVCSHKIVILGDMGVGKTCISIR